MRRRAAPSATTSKAPDWSASAAMAIMPRKNRKTFQSESSRRMPGTKRDQSRQEDECGAKQRRDSLIQARSGRMTTRESVRTVIVTATAAVGRKGSERTSATIAAEGRRP